LLDMDMNGKHAREGRDVGSREWIVQTMLEKNARREIWEMNEGELLDKYGGQGEEVFTLQHRTRGGW
jgi:hypothetical protein